MQHSGTDRDSTLPADDAPGPLTAALAAPGFTARIGQTARYFIYGYVLDNGATLDQR